MLKPLHLALLPRRDVDCWHQKPTLAQIRSMPAFSTTSVQRLMSAAIKSASSLGDELFGMAPSASIFWQRDSDRPQLMKQVFAGNYELEMAVKTDAISFPSSAKGLESISQVLVTNFAEQYENVRTLCLSRPDSDYLSHFRCDWLVGMSARQGGAVRVGCGHYSWYFGSDDDGRVKKLVIDIEVMCVLPVEESEPIMQWLAALPYPWCSDIQARESIPALDALRPIERFLRRMEMDKLGETPLL